MDTNILHTSYIMNDQGILFVGQVVQCLSCDTVGQAYLNMSIVASDDTLPGVECPNCHEPALKVITFD